MGGWRGVPSLMPAGYSGTPLPAKLGLVPTKAQSLYLKSAPIDFLRTLGPLPKDCTLLTRLPSRGAPDITLAFITSQTQLATVLAQLAPRIRRAEMLWIAWPKKSSGVETDVSEIDIRTAAISAGLVDTKVCAVTEIWSGLRLVRPVKDRDPA